MSEENELPEFLGIDTSSEFNTSRMDKAVSIFCRLLITRAIREAGIPRWIFHCEDKKSAPMIVYGLAEAKEFVADIYYEFNKWSGDCWKISAISPSRGTQYGRDTNKKFMSEISNAFTGGKSVVFLSHNESCVQEIFDQSDCRILFRDADKSFMKRFMLAYGVRMEIPDNVDYSLITPTILKIAFRSPEIKLNFVRLFGLITEKKPSARMRASVDKASEAQSKPQGWAGLIGMKEAQEWGEDLKRDIQDFKNFSISWSEVDCGLVLSGAPGTGKTRFAQALAYECGMPLVVTSLAQWQAKGHLGDLLKEMRKVFAEAEEKAPCILFIDELDSIGSRGSESRYSRYDDQVTNALLELVGGLSSRDGMVIIGACNYPHKLDPALLRSGRLEKHIRIELPDKEARLKIFGIYSGLNPENLESLGFMSGGMTGADIESVCKDAKRLARKERAKLEEYHISAALYARKRLILNAAVDLTKWNPSQENPKH